MISAAVLCLATTLYHEARGESIDGQLAVAEVILNRVEDPRWPSKVCDVVEQERQFKSSGPIKEKELFQELYQLSKGILKGEEELLGLTSTHFYSGHEKPFWTKELEHDGRIGGHHFYTE
jgi:N-acetylmuramoyl-L-alanine amidase